MSAWTKAYWPRSGERDRPRARGARAGRAPASAASSVASVGPADTAASPADVKLWPSTAASWTSARSAGSSASRRAAISAVRVSGTASSSRSPSAGTCRPRLDEPALGDEHPDRLDRVERDRRRRGRRSRRPRASGRPGTRPASSSRIVGSGSGSRSMRREVALAGAPVRPPLEQLRPGQGDDVDRHAARPVEQVVDEVEQCPGRPSGGPRRPGRPGRRGDPLEERAPGGEQLVGADCAAARRRAARGAPARSSAARLVGATLGDRRRDLRPRSSPRRRSRRARRARGPSRPAPRT